MVLIEKYVKLEEASQHDHPSKTWTLGASYAVGDWVWNDGITYKVKVAHVATAENEPATTGITGVWQPASDNLYSLDDLVYASPAFVKMTNANTFSLDTGERIKVSQATPQTIGTNSERLTKLWTTDVDAIGNIRVAGRIVAQQNGDYLHIGYEDAVWMGYISLNMYHDGTNWVQATAGYAGCGLSFTMDSDFIFSSNPTGGGTGNTVVPVEHARIQHATGYVGFATSMSGAYSTYRTVNINGAQLFVGQSSTPTEESLVEILPALGGTGTHADFTSVTTIKSGSSAGLLETMRFGNDKTAALLGFFGHAAHAQPAKASHNNWAALSDVVAALVEIGLLDAA
jgi:hypothetical protein